MSKLSTVALSKFVLKDSDYFVQNKPRQQEVSAYYNLIRSENKPCITLTEKKVCLDTVEGFNASSQDLSEETLALVYKAFTSKPMTAKSIRDFRPGEMTHVIYATYLNTQDAAIVANELAAIDYKTITKQR
jgi:hypothetical protein